MYFIITPQFLHPGDELLLGYHHPVADTERGKLRLMHQLVATGRSNAPHHELVEKLYFDRLVSFLYVELKRDLQRGFVPKRCANYGRWLLQTPGASCNYCDQPTPNSEEGKTCREVGSTKNLRAKVLNHPVGAIHQRAHKKHFARTKKSAMSKADFEV